MRVVCEREGGRSQKESIILENGASLGEVLFSMQGTEPQEGSKSW